MATTGTRQPAMARIRSNRRGPLRTGSSARRRRRPRVLEGHRSRTDSPPHSKSGGQIGSTARGPEQTAAATAMSPNHWSASMWSQKGSPTNEFQTQQSSIQVGGRSWGDRNRSTLRCPECPGRQRIGGLEKVRPKHRSGASQPQPQQISKPPEGNMENTFVPDLEVGASGMTPG